MLSIYRGPAFSPNCASCPCAVNEQPVKPIRGAGQPHSLAIVGEGPSTEELHQGWPFVGQSGKLLQQVLNDASIDRHTIWITNALLCQRPFDNAKLAQAIDCCRPRLQQELSSVAPKAICALGGSAAKALQLPITAITDARGTTQHSPLTSTVPIVVAIHPAAILRGGAGEIKGGGKQKMNVDAQYIFLSADVAKAYSIAQGTIEPWQDDIALIVEDSIDSQHKIFRVLDAAALNGLLAIDLEWNAERKITWLGLASHDRATSNRANAVAVYWPFLAPSMRNAIADYGYRRSIAKLFHNLQADIDIWEAQIGPIDGPIEDTMLLHHAAFPGAAHDLQNVASQFLAIPPWKANRATEEKHAGKLIAANARAATKLAKKLTHEANNAASAQSAKERKRQRKSMSIDKLLKLIGD